MSFKRDESDPGPLGALQRRRVAELLASAIPEDEALLLRDGRLACSLCPHRPVCDTLQMLVLHRAGRKHLDSLQRSYGRRCPQLTPPGPQVAPPEPQGVAPRVQAPLLARTRRIAHSALLSSAPYSGCCWRAARSGGGRAGSAAGNPRERQREQQREREQRREREQQREQQREWEPEQRERERRGRGGAEEEGNSRFSEGKSQIPKENSQFSKENSRISKENSQISEGPSPERLRLLRHYLDLRSRGWLQDPSGRWLKDGAAEFDSDEEEPPALPPA